jgi:hypothetical protein
MSSVLKKKNNRNGAEGAEGTRIRKIYVFSFLIRLMRLRG